MIWVRGSKDDPATVIAELQQKGGNNRNAYKGDDVNAVYFIGRTGEIEKTSNPELKWIITDGMEA